MTTDAPVSDSEDGTDNHDSNAPTSPSAMQRMFALDSVTATDDEIQGLANEHVAEVLSADVLAVSNNVLFLYDRDSITRTDADRIYRALAKTDRDKSNLLIMHSPGGDVAAAYFIAKLCREYTNRSFEVAVPRRAKSAATLIACGADKIHMGSLSELGPIDPQFGQIPALALKHSIEHIAGLIKQYPESAEMFATYLSSSVRVEALGFYERVAESTTDYAMRLLKSRIPDSDDHKRTARRLVYDYKDHGFVIDANEASEIFGNQFIALNTPQYDLANRLYSTIDFLRYLIDTRFNRDFSFTGSAADGCWVFERKASAQAS